MANRGTIRTSLLALLGTSSDDPLYSATVLNPIIQQALDALLADVQDANPDYLALPPITLAADSASSHLYTFASQSTPITDFGKWLDVRYTDEDGTPLAECRLDELREFGTDYFTLYGTDESPILQTSHDSPAGTALYFRYAAWPAELVDDSSVPAGLSTRYHDVVALEALFAFGLGGEQQRPRDLEMRWRDRRAQMLSRVGRRGIQPSRSRVVAVDL